MTCGIVDDYLSHPKCEGRVYKFQYITAHFDNVIVSDPIHQEFL